MPPCRSPTKRSGTDHGRVSAAERELVAQRAAHVREVLTGYASGHMGPDTRRRPAGRAPRGVRRWVPLTARYAAKAAELSVTARTVQNWVAAYRDGGEAAMIDVVAVGPQWTRAGTLRCAPNWQ
jgi:hypothetical protein